MSKTRDELVQYTAELLFLVGAGQSLEDEDEQKIDGQVDPLLAQLSADGIVSIQDDEIPDEHFNSLAQLLKNVCSTTFGQQYSDDVKTAFEKQIIRMMSRRPTYTRLQTDYF